MANVQHNALTGSSLHENKGVSSATDNTVATASSGATVWQKLTASHLTGTGNPFGAQLLHVQDEQTSGTNGASILTGSWFKRTLNTVKTNEISGASLASSVITLPAGTYHVSARGPAYSSSRHQIRLRNTTDSTDLALGSTAYTQGGGPSTSTYSDSIIEQRFTLSGTKTIELQHRVAEGADLGIAASWGTEIYAQVWIWKIG